MSPKSETTQSSEEAQKNKGIVAVAWISFGSAIIVAFIAAFPQIYPIIFTQTPSPQPTILSSETPSVVPSSEATYTVASATSTLPLTFSTPVPLGEDWDRGCISTLWQTYPLSISSIADENGCWEEPVHAYSAENGALNFFFERKGGSPEVYGLFAPLPENGTVNFTVRLRDLYNADLWMGIYETPSLDSQGLLMTILNGNVEKRSVIQKDPHTYETLQGSVALAQENGYSITFSFDTLYVSSRVNPAIFVVNPVSLPSAKKWLFLGYKGLNGSYRIDGTFLDFEVK